MATNNAVQTCIVVNAPVGEVYRMWLCFEELPSFTGACTTCARIDDVRFGFTVIRDGETQRGTFEITFRTPERRIAWKTVSESRTALGVVSFEPLSDDVTEITLKSRPASSPVFSPEHLGAFKKWIETRPAKG